MTQFVFRSLRAFVLSHPLFLIPYFLFLSLWPMENFSTSIRPPSGFSLGLKELWQYRELFYFFTWRDVKVRYKQTYVGVLWALLQPLGMMLIFTFIFQIHSNHK